MLTKKLTFALNKFYHDMAISELKYQNSFTGREKLTYSDILYMDIISAHPDEYTSSQIADMLCVSRPSVTSKISSLVKRGYLMRRQDENDKRIFYLSVMEGSYSDANEEKLDRVIVEQILEKYTEQDVHILCETLSMVGDALRDENYE